MTQIAFLGAGNMAEALIGGLISSKNAQASSIIGIDTDPGRRNRLSETFKITCVSRLNELDLEKIDVLVLALKPQVLPKVLEENQHLGKQSQLLLVSIAAGITCDQITHCLGAQLPLVRCMPNTPAQIGQGMTALYANALVSAEQRAVATRLASAVGSTLWLDQETLLNAVTAISGSGPAYFYYLMEAMIKAGQVLGLNEDQSQQLVLQTALGTSNLALSSLRPVSTLRTEVTSEGGTTQAAMAHLDAASVMQEIEKAVLAATKRSIELSQ